MHSVASTERQVALEKVEFDLSVGSPDSPRLANVHASVEHLRKCIEKVAAFLLEKAGVGEARKREVG